MTATTAPVRRRIGPALEPYVLVIIFVTMFAVFAFSSKTSDLFTSHANLSSVLANQSVLGVLALGSLAPLVCRNFDLSVGAIASLSQIAIAAGMSRFDLPLGVALVVGIAIGTMVGVVNGIVVTRFRVNALIATLGMATFVGGLIQAYTEGQTISSGISRNLVKFGSEEHLGVPNMMYVLAIVALTV